MTITELYPNIFQIDIPLPHSSPSVLHTYLIRAKPRSMLIDTGYNHENCISTMLEALKILEVSLESLDVFITHGHSDHIAMSSALIRRGTRFLCSRIDIDLFDKIFCKPRATDLPSNGYLYSIPEEKLADFSEHPAFRYRPAILPEFQYVRANMSYRIGDYQIEVVDLAGHTPGQLGIYLKKPDLLFSGDLIISGRTPNLTYFPNCPDVVCLHMSTLLRVKKMNVSCLYPAHGPRITNFSTQVEQIFAHYSLRCQEVMNILESGEQNAYQVAAAMEWPFGGGVFSHFSPQQCWFATNEAYVYLEHLMQQKLLSRTGKNQVHFYARIKNKKQQ